MLVITRQGSRWRKATRVSKEIKYRRKQEIKMTSRLIKPINYIAITQNKIPYSGKLWRALNLVNQSSECIGEFKFGNREGFQ